MATKMVATLGSPSSHGGTITVPGQVTVLATGLPIAVAGAMHSCPIIGHGTKPVTPITTKTFVAGKLVVTFGATAGCGAIIQPVGKTVFAE